MKKYRIYTLVYLLVKLTLLLPVATAIVKSIFYNENHQDLIMQSIERWFDECCLVTSIEKDIFKTIDNKYIIQRFQNMKPRIVLL